MAARKSSSTVLGVDGPARDEAVAAAKRAGMSTGEWLEPAVRTWKAERLAAAFEAWML